MEAFGRLRERAGRCLAGVPGMLGALALLAGCQGGPEDLGAENVDWPVYGGSSGEQHYSPLEAINRETVARLAPVQAIALDVPRANSEPLEVDGVLYVAAGWSVVQAFDVESGERLWRFQPELEPTGLKMRFAWGVRGLAYDNGRLFVGAQDGRLFALNAGSGALDWEVQTTEGKDDGRYITGAPRVFDGKVVIGHGGADFAPVRGYVTAYDQASGAQAWRFYTVPGNPADGFEDAAQKMAAQTWTGEWWKYGGGGTAWNAITYDAELGQVYIGTGNGAPWNPKIRSPEGGDNLFLASVVALDAESGEYLWHYQHNPGEAWDYNSTMDIELAELEIDGVRRKVLLQAPKNGFFYVVDRESGALISAEKLGKVTWAARIDMATGRPVENPGMRYQDGPSEVWPGNLGLHNWPPMAFNPGTGLVYIPTLESGMRMHDEGIDPASWAPVPGALNNGVTDLYSDGFPSTARTTLLAWNPVTQTGAWEVETPSPWNGGALTTAGGLVFQGQVDGNLVARDAATGEELWRYDVGTAALGTPISFSHGRRQYVALVVGPPVGSQFVLDGISDYDRNYRTQKPMLVLFALDGTATIPAPAEPGPEQVLVDPDMQLDPAKVALGSQLWGACMGCHGNAARSPGSAPDLRASPIHLDAEAFDSVVRGGAMAGNGMPVFADFDLSMQDAVRQFVQSQARKAQ